MFKPSAENYNFLERCQILDRQVLDDYRGQLTSRKVKDKKELTLQIRYLTEVIKKRSDDMQMMLLRMTLYDVTQVGKETAA